MVKEQELRQCLVQLDVHRLLKPQDTQAALSRFKTVSYILGFSICAGSCLFRGGLRTLPILALLLLPGEPNNAENIDQHWTKQEKTLIKPSFYFLEGSLSNSFTPPRGLLS